MNPRFLDAARADVLDASDTYDAKSSGLGTRFSDAVIETAEIVARMPHAYERISPCPRGREVRLRLVVDFPWLFVYEVTATEIVVVSVSHAHSIQQPWLRRLGP